MRGDCVQYINRKFYQKCHACLRGFWIAATGNAAFVLRYIQKLSESPADAMTGGMSLTLVPDMLEHILMSMVLLLIGGLLLDFHQNSEERNNGSVG